MKTRSFKALIIGGMGMLMVTGTAQAATTVMNGTLFNSQTNTHTSQLSTVNISSFGAGDSTITNQVAGNSAAIDGLLSHNIKVDAIQKNLSTSQLGIINMKNLGVQSLDVNGLVVGNSFNASIDGAKNATMNLVQANQSTSQINKITLGNFGVTHDLNIGGVAVGNSSSFTLGKP